MHKPEDLQEIEAQIDETKLEIAKRSKRLWQIEKDLKGVQGEMQKIKEFRSRRMLGKNIQNSVRYKAQLEVKAAGLYAQRQTAEVELNKALQRERELEDTIDEHTLEINEERL